MKDTASNSKCRVCEGTGLLFPPATKALTNRIECANCKGTGKVTESKKVIKTDRLHRWGWVVFHPVAWFKTRKVRKRIDKMLKVTKYE